MLAISLHDMALGAPTTPGAEGAVHDQAAEPHPEFNGATGAVGPQVHDCLFRDYVGVKASKVNGEGGLTAPPLGERGESGAGETAGAIDDEHLDGVVLDDLFVWVVDGEFHVPVGGENGGGREIEGRNGDR